MKKFYLFTTILLIVCFTATPVLATCSTYQTTTRTSNITTTNINTPITTSTVSKPVSTPVLRTTKIDRPTAVNRYNILKQEYTQATNRYQHTKKGLIQLKETHTKLKNSESLTALNRARSEHTKYSTEAIIKHLEILKVRVGESTLTTEIDQDIEWLENQQELVDSAETSDDLHPLLTSNKEHWKTIKVHTKKVVGYILTANFERFANHMEQLSERLSTFVAESANQTAPPLVTQANEKIASALEKYEEAKTKFNAIDTLENAQTLFSEGHKLLLEAKQDLLSAHQLLHQAVQELKQT